MNAPVLCWFRRDLRLRDNPALRKSIESGAPVIPVYIHDVNGEGAWKAGGASKWWLHHSLLSLEQSLREMGSRLIVRTGASGEILKALCEETGATAVYWNRRYEPAIIQRDRRIKQELRERGLETESFNGSLLFEPHTIENKQAKPFQVFTPYWRHCLAKGIGDEKSPGLKTIPPPEAWPDSVRVGDLNLRSKIPWADGFAEHGHAGEEEAIRKLKRFVAKRVDHYEASRDLPAVEGTSRLSAHLHFGEISPRQIWKALRKRGASSGVFPSSKGEQVYLSELGWREFAHHLLYHFPRTPEKPLRENYERFPWAEDRDGRKLKAWQQGQTGYPIVDAGMRELWQTGWMHNRVRMITASFLVKHLRLPWQRGAEWFWDTLVDADLANNTLGWQWTAGCGADAAPFFRIFAPVSQGKRFDPKGDYVRRWVPELAGLGTRFIHAPWEAPDEMMAEAGITLGRDYPKPMVDHAEARHAALTAWKQMKDTP